MRISSNFDSGNIECLDCSSPTDIQLAIKRDANPDFCQWFHFRLTGARGQDCVLRIMNAGRAAYPKGWEGYQVCASYDRQDWFRVPTRYDGTVLTIDHRPERDSIYYAYFASYAMERHAQLIAEALARPSVRLEVPGVTLDGQDIDLLHIGENGPGKRQCWIIGRQHPGEVMASWWMDGFLERLLDPADPVSRDVLQRAVVHIVPNMNPDGSRRGHHRTNAAGVDLNRAWAEPSLERSPEVFLIRQAMASTGVDFFLDVHGEEALPYSFIANSWGGAAAIAKQGALNKTYTTILAAAGVGFQTEHGYPNSGGGGTPYLLIGANYVAATHSCLAMSLEMPFKDNRAAPDPRTGWSPAHCRALGKANLDALRSVLDSL